MTWEQHTNDSFIGRCMDSIGSVLLLFDSHHGSFVIISDILEENINNKKIISFFHLWYFILHLFVCWKIQCRVLIGCIRNKLYDRLIEVLFPVVNRYRRKRFVSQGQVKWEKYIHSLCIWSRSFSLWFSKKKPEKIDHKYLLKKKARKEKCHQRGIFFFLSMRQQMIHSLVSTTNPLVYFLTSLYHICVL